MRITVNGEHRDIAPSVTVAQLVSTLITATTGVAVAVDATVVPRSRWEHTQFVDGATVEILTAAPGG